LQQADTNGKRKAMILNSHLLCPTECIETKNWWSKQV